MPNQLNFPDALPSPYIGARPERLAQSDRNLIEVGTQQILFGTTNQDVVELWMYDANGSIAGHLNLRPQDPALSLTTVIDNTGAYEMLNLDMGDLMRRMFIESGRYAFVANFFRDEVGSESDNKLYIADISDDRTELRLHVKHVDDAILRQLFEWVVPSVPKLIAQGLVDEIFGKSLDAQPNEILTVPRVTADLDYVTADTSARIHYALADSAYTQMVTTVMEAAHPRILAAMAADVMNVNVQDADLEAYIHATITEVVRELKDRGQIDSRFNVF